MKFGNLNKSEKQNEENVIEVNSSSSEMTPRYTRRFTCCTGIYKPRWLESKKNILDVFETIKGLENYQEGIFYLRYYPIFMEYRRRCLLYAIIFHGSRFIVTVGSITVPALLSLQNANDDRLKWLVWTVSLAVTIFNGILTLFKIDKKYFFLHTTSAFLEREGWQFIGLSGKYAKTHGTESSNSHEHQFPYFCEAIERIKIKQVEEEYYKSQEANSDSSAPHAQPAQKTPSATLSDYYGASSSSTSASASKTPEAKAWADNVAERTQEALRAMKQSV